MECQETSFNAGYGLNLILSRWYLPTTTLTRASHAKARSIISSECHHLVSEQLDFPGYQLHCRNRFVNAMRIRPPFRQALLTFLLPPCSLSDSISVETFANILCRDQEVRLPTPYSSRFQRFPSSSTSGTAKPHSLCPN